MFESVVTVYKRQERARRFKKLMALLCISAAVVLLGFGFGALVFTSQSPALCAAGVVILIAGMWGAHHLSTRH